MLKYIKYVTKNNFSAFTLGGAVVFTLNALSSKRKVAAASRMRKDKCDNVCVMNFVAGQRIAFPI